MEGVVVKITDKTLVCGNNLEVVCNASKKIKVSGIVVGDRVRFSETDNSYVIDEVLERKNLFVRPSIANVDQLLIFVASVPKTDFSLIDKLIVSSFINGVTPSICINKTDLEGMEFINNIKDEYSFLKIFEISALSDKTLTELKKALKNKITAFAGQSGVGKTSVVNALTNKTQKTGELSLKTETGKHTTRGSELYALGGSSFIVDTPGFLKLDIFKIQPAELCKYYPDFFDYAKKCKFNSCIHIFENTSDCNVKRALKDCKINKNRYNRYVDIYTKLKKMQEDLW